MVEGRLATHLLGCGGRKTMSIYLTIAMMLYGRADDRLFTSLSILRNLNLAGILFIVCVPRQLRSTTDGEVDQENFHGTSP